MGTPCADAGLPSFGLSAAEYHAQLYLIYTGEVGNGGHMQYFLNRRLKFTDDTISALSAVGLKEASEILRQAKACAPDVRSLEEGRVSGETIRRWDELDNRLFALLPDVDAALLKYLREHESDVLVLERSKA